MVVRVFGRWAPECGGELNDKTNAEIQELLFDVVELCEQAKALGLCPTFDASLIWLCKTKHTRILLPLVAKPWTEEAETAAIGGISKLLYLLLADIEPEESHATKNVISLGRWAKNISTALSNVMARCIWSLDNAPAIKTHAELLAALQNESSQPAWLPPDDSIRGLAKVAGMERLKSILRRDVVSPLREPDMFQRYGLTVPSGMLLFGPPGCGKTYIAKQLAEELGYYFVQVIPSEIGGMFIHQSVIKIREVFDDAALMSPAIIFIDEFEAMVPSRSALGAHQQYKAEEVNEFLVQLGTCAERNIFVIAATNEPDKIDIAVRRTGRMDKLIYVGPPDEEARTEMLSLHLRNRPIADLDLRALASSLSGYAASDIKFLVDEAARAALQENSTIANVLIVRSYCAAIQYGCSTSPYWDKLQLRNTVQGSGVLQNFPRPGACWSSPLGVRTGPSRNPTE